MKIIPVLLVAAGLAALGAIAQDRNPAATGSYSDFVERGGIAIYTGIVPTAQIERYPAYSAERAMLGGMPKRHDAHHLMVALFDAETHARIEDAEVRVTLAEVGLAGQSKRLKLFAANGAVTYCNYFVLTPATHYRLRLDIRRPGDAPPLRREFTFRLEHT